MLQNPFLPAPGAARAWAEGFTKGFVALASPEASDNVAAEDVDAFNQGVTAGAASAASGLALADPCVSASDEHGPMHVPGIAINVAEIAHGAWEMRQVATLAAGVANAVVALLELACTLPVRTLPPEEVLPGLGQPVIDALASYGLESMEIFCGAGLDGTVADCEIRLSPLFPSLDQARDAAIALNRPQWVVASWRTDQSNSFRIADSG